MCPQGCGGSSPPFGTKENQPLPETSSPDSTAAFTLCADDAQARACGARRRSKNPLVRLVLILLVCALAACSVTPTERQAIEDAWAKHDAEIAKECRRNGVGYAAGGCIAGGQ